MHVDQAINYMENRGLCLTMVKQSNAGVDKTPPFALQYKDCSEQKAFVCTLSMQEEVSLRKPPRFPCMSKTKRARQKRTILDSGTETRPRNNEGTAYFDSYSKI